MSDNEHHPAHDAPLEALFPNSVHLKDLEYIFELASLYLKDTGGQWPERITKYRAALKQLISKGDGFTHEEHTERHRFLHRCFDELLADWIGHTRQLPSKATVRQLMQWSYQQTLDATEDRE